MNSYKQNQHVRLRIPKSKLDKFDRKTGQLRNLK